MVNSRVYAALSRPLVGHLDPYFLTVLDQVQDGLRRIFGTSNTMTLPISGTGSAGMEACFANLVEQDDEVVIGVNGVFGTRMAEVATRLGARVERAEAEWGRIVEPDQIAAAIGRCSNPKIVAVVHAETSTGAWQPLHEISRLARAAGALLLVDCVTSLGGCPVEIDDLCIDAAYSGTQKCLSCPPGLSPVTLSERAMEAVRARKSRPRSWYLDLGLIGAYFGEQRLYHHTAPVSMVYALAEAVAIVLEEGLEDRYVRHERNHQALMAGLARLGLQAAAQEGHRLWMLNSVRVPEGIAEAAVRKRLLLDHGIEIGAGLGPLAGKTWRIGLMGESSRPANVRRLLLALESELRREGIAAPPGEAVEAADAVYAQG
ncbi:MAG TPA: alanine--glyoxylate aminotransferase family protein [Candidatus Limnocylindrales bacterium]|nr:alanine--glyoxylate aminotransferase family protein [Candidatus Limnocylindrales bacterium]